MADASELPDPETLVYQFSEAATDERGDDQAQEYLVRFADELFLLEPGLAEHFADTVLTDLKEEIAHREDSRHAHAVIELIRQIEQDWRNDA